MLTIINSHGKVSVALRFMRGPAAILPPWWPDRSKDLGGCGDTVGGVSLEGCFRFVSIDGGWGDGSLMILVATVTDVLQEICPKV